MFVMLKLSRLAGALAAVLVCAQTAPAAAGWKLVFSDEFSGGSLDRTKWKPGDLWSNQTFAGNQEKQCYRDSQLSVESGVLKIRAEKKAILQRECKAAQFDLSYVSGTVTTAGCNIWERGPVCAKLKAFSQAYGYYEIRARMPKGRGLWPSIRLMPEDGSFPPGVVVMEAFGQEPTRIRNAYSYKDASGADQHRTGDCNCPDATSDFRVYGFNWRPGRMIWTVDGTEVARVEGPDVTSKPMFLSVNLAVGGQWAQDPDETTQFPATMDIDYVRVYAPVEDGQPDDAPPAAAR